MRVFQEIFSGALKPGDAIVERHLALEMKVGAPVIREALISLQGQGFVPSRDKYRWRRARRSSRRAGTS
jgi:DNA-binding GntR family transcriptional regulator